MGDNVYVTERGESVAGIGRRRLTRMQECCRVLCSKVLPEWRNWQTRWIQNPVPARACGFESHLRYLRDSVQRRVYVFNFIVDRNIIN